MMKKPVILLALAAVACAEADAREKPMTAEEKEVYAAYEAINAAMIAKDRSALERYFDVNLTFTHMSGKKQTREEFIGEIMDGTRNYYKIDTKNCAIRVDGKTAYMRVTHALTVKVYGMRGAWTLSGTSTYQKRDGIWVRVERSAPRGVF